MATKAMSAMDVDSSIAGTERLLAQGADGSIIVVSTLSAYVIDDLIASTAATPTTGDLLLGARGTDEKTFTLDLVAAYALTYAYSNATTLTPALTGDSLLVQRSGTLYDMNIDTIKTYALVGIQATVWDLSAIGTATLAAGDLLGVCQTATLKKTTLTALTTYLDAALIVLGTMQASACAYLKTYLAALSAKTTGEAADTVYVINGSTAYKMTLATIAEYCVDATYDLPWQLIPAASYTALATSTSTLAMSDTTGMAVGLPIKFTLSGTVYYAIITSVSGSSSISIAGAPFSATVALTSLYVGTPGQVKTVTYWIDDLFGDAVQDLLSLNGRYDRWEGVDAYLVAFAATCGEVDTGADQPYVNVKVGGTAVATTGVQLSGTIGTWTANSAVEISTTNYKIEQGDAIEVACTVAGTNADAADLSITLTFVYE